MHRFQCISNQQRLWQQHNLGFCQLQLRPSSSRVCCSLPAPSAAAVMSRTTSRITVEPSEIGTGAVFPEQYEEQLANKLARVKELFNGLKLPAVEVFRSEPAHFRSRAEFRLWSQGDDLFYIMFEKPAADLNGEGATPESNSGPPTQQHDVAEISAPEQQQNVDNTHHAVGAGADAGALVASAQQAAVSPAEQQQQQQQYRKGKRKGGRRRSTKSSAAGSDGGAADGSAELPGKRYPRRVRIDDFPVADQLICEVMPLLRQELMHSPALRDKAFQANFHCSLSKQLVVTLAYHRVLDDVWQQAAQELRGRLLKSLGPDRCEVLNIIGRSRKQKIVLGADHVVERFRVDGRDYQYMQVEGAFSQPNAGVCQQMLNWAADVTRGSAGDLLELYCGNGNFTIPLAQNFKQVVATEVSKASVAAARHNIAVNAADNILMARMSSQEFTETWKVKGTRNRLAGLDWEQLSLDTLFVDPPRAGLDEATVQLLQDFKQVVYISCNPETLAANLQGVADSHDITRFAVFDQFPYTHHLECGAFLVKKTASDAEAR